MPSLEEVALLALELPEVTEGDRFGGRTWSVKDKVFAWERSFTKADIKRFGTETPPAGDILAVRTADVHEKEAILAEGVKGFFTIPHLNGYPALLIQLKSVGKRALREALVDAWLSQAPQKLADEFFSR